MFKHIKIFNYGKFRKLKIEHVNLFYSSFDGPLIQAFFTFNVKFYNYN